MVECGLDVKGLECRSLGLNVVDDGWMWFRGERFRAPSWITLKWLDQLKLMFAKPNVLMLRNFFCQTL